MNTALASARVGHFAIKLVQMRGRLRRYLFWGVPNRSLACISQLKQTEIA